ncbi:MAG TPA: hypothetical protein VHN78_12970, partial [Chloroflexota bacterium]|nr:hypothetical protein [Chloroflexota bacterium]
GPVAPAPFTTVDVRPVHVAEPEAEPELEDTAPPTLEALAARFGAPQPEPERDEPATLEALAARFSHQEPPRPRGAAQGATRSQQEREKQAAILARLRSGQSS